MKEFRPVFSRFVIFAVLAAIAAAGCKSIPVLAMVTVKDRPVSLVADEKKMPPEALMLIRKVVLSPDRAHLLVVCEPGGEPVLFETATGRISANTTLAEKLNETARVCSANGRYCAEHYLADEFIKRYGARVREMNTGGVLGTVDPGYTNFVGLFSFPRNDLFVVQLWSGSQEFRFYRVPEMALLASQPVTYTVMSMDEIRHSLTFDRSGDCVILHDVILHDSKLIHIYSGRDGRQLATMFMKDANNWLVVSTEGYFDGTPSMFDGLTWKVDKENIPLSQFDKSGFLRQGLLGSVLGLRPLPPKSFSIGESLIGKIWKIEPSGEVVITCGGTQLNMGDRVFSVIDGREISLNVTFPMMTTARCRVSPQDAAFASKLAVGIPVFKRGVK
ncbi:MAG: hypothetical protein MUD12_11465 [Spirochaetes bacterium]|nr:hypothetical protein [Spirochaetota bacterium]